MTEHGDLDNLYGESVLVVRTGDGWIEREWLPAGIAVEDVLFNPENGVTIRSAHIVWFDVLDEWGRSP